MGKAAAIPQHVFDDERLRGGSLGSFNCDICGAEYPVRHQEFQPGGDELSSSAFVGRFCCHEPEGSSIDRDLKRAAAATMVAALSAVEQQPPSHDGQVATGYDSVPFYPSFVVSVDPFPVVLIRGGVAVPVSLTGNGFDAGDTIVYGSGGITDATPPVLVSDILRTLSVQASGGMNAGRYSFTFNGTVWPRLFDVR